MKWFSNLRKEDGNTDLQKKLQKKYEEINTLAELENKQEKIDFLNEEIRILKYQISKDTKRKTIITEEKPYDMTFKVTTIEKGVSKGWEITKLNEIEPKWNGLILGVIGRFNQGKTHFLQN